VNERINDLFTRVDALSLRERGMIFATLLLLLLLVWYGLFMEPLGKREQARAAEKLALGTRLQNLDAQLAALGGRLGEDRGVAANEQSSRIATEIAALERELETYLQDLIAPTEMAAVLEEVLAEQPGLELMGVRNLEPEALLAGEEGGAGTVRNVYRHGLELTIEGGYRDCLRYLEVLEALPWRIYWKRLDLESEEYPRNRITIQVQTLSLEQELLGV
jgi:MSHA biogenesis protein MshJ